MAISRGSDYIIELCGTCGEHHLPPLPARHVLPVELDRTGIISLHRNRRLNGHHDRSTRAQLPGSTLRSRGSALPSYWAPGSHKDLSPEHEAGGDDLEDPEDTGLNQTPEQEQEQELEETTYVRDQDDQSKERDDPKIGKEGDGDPTPQVDRSKEDPVPKEIGPPPGQDDPYLPPSVHGGATSGGPAPKGIGGGGGQSGGRDGIGKSRPPKGTQKPQQGIKMTNCLKDAQDQLWDAKITVLNFFADLWIDKIRQNDLDHGKHYSNDYYDARRLDFLYALENHQVGDGYDALWNYYSGKIGCGGTDSLSACVFRGAFEQCGGR